MSIYIGGGTHAEKVKIDGEKVKKRMNLVSQDMNMILTEEEYQNSIFYNQPNVLDFIPLTLERDFYVKYDDEVFEYYR